MNYIYKIVVCLFTLFSTSQIAFSQALPCVRHISTNPNNPINQEWNNLHPGKTNNFLNTYFNWYPLPYGTITISIDKTQNWATPYASQSGIISMDNPFRNENGNGTKYLQRGDIELRDFRWEDGWELLHMNVGRYPNGDKVNVPNPNHWLTGAHTADPKPNNGPFFILYNRYRGILRVFANLWFTDNSVGTEEDIIIRLEMEGTPDLITNETTFSGVFRLANGLDQALDQSSKITYLTSPRQHAGELSEGNANTSQWVGADFQMAYDPCQCRIPTQFKIYFQTRDTYNVALTHREISYDKDLTDLNDAEQDFFSSMTDEEGNIIAPGNVAYESINVLLDDYKKAMEDYNDQLNDYNSPVNELKKLAVSAIQTGVSGGFNLTGTTAALTKFINNNQIPLWSDKFDGDDTKAESKELAKEYTKAGKKFLAEQFDFLNVLLDVQEKPLKPQTPQATFTEGKTMGKITKEYTFDSEVLFMPGTVPTANSDVAALGSHNFPAYNNVMGLFAVTTTPTPDLFVGGLELTYKPKNLHYFFKEELPFYHPGSESAWFFRGDIDYSFKKQHKFYMANGVDFKLNDALDWDNSKSTVLVALQVELERTHTAKEASLNRRFFASNTSNFELLHSFSSTSKNGDTKIQTNTFISNYYNIEDIKNVLFNLEINESWTSSFNFFLFSPPAKLDNFDQALDEFSLNFEGGLGSVPEQPKYSIKSIKLKVILDSYFNQIGYFQPDPDNPDWQGAQVNNFQVRTFELYNSASSKSLSEQLGGINLETPESIAKYTTGKVTLELEDDFKTKAIEVQNGVNYFVKAEKVEAKGQMFPLNQNLPANGFVEAVEEVRLKTGSHIGPGSRFSIEKAMFGKPKNLPLTPAEISSFCNTSYAGNTISTKTAQIVETIEAQRLQERKQKGLELSLSPNPAKDWIGIQIKHLPNNSAEIGMTLMDLSGRVILTDSQASSANGRYVIDLPELSKGVYVLKVTAGGHETSERIVIQ